MHRFVLFFGSCVICCVNEVSNLSLSQEKPLEQLNFVSLSLFAAEILFKLFADLRRFIGLKIAKISILKVTVYCVEDYAVSH